MSVGRDTKPVVGDEEGQTVVARPRSRPPGDVSEERERFVVEEPSASVSSEGTVSVAGVSSAGVSSTRDSLLPRDSLAPAGGASGAGTRVASLTSSRDFLRQDERTRIGALSVGVLVSCLLVLTMIGSLPSDPLAKRWALVGLGMLVVGFGGLVWLTRKSERFHPAHVGALSVINAAASGFMAFYFGTFSAFPALVALTLYTYALGAPWGWSLAVYVVAAGAQLTLGMLVTFEVIPDRGIIRPEGLDTFTRFVAQLSVQLVYGLAFIAGRFMAGRTRTAVNALEGAVRQVAAREALLREARADLERAAGIGEEGRFSGQHLGRFVMGVIIGRGGMGEIYEARDEGSGEEAAVKLLHRSALLDADPIARFEREARIIASLDSPHVVRVLEIGGADAPLPFLAMERLRGHDLAWHLRERRRLAPTQVVDMVEQVAEGLAAAWAQRVVHRDLKPQNLFRTNDGVWKVLDFGVSKLAGDSGTLSAGHLVGTPGYMSPEQATGGEVDHRTDVHALAAIAYRALTGRPAFAAKDVPQIVHAVACSLPPRPGELASVPGGVDDVLRIGLAKDPARRFETARELSRALRGAIEGERDAELANRARTLEASLAWGGWTR